MRRGIEAGVGIGVQASFGQRPDFGQAGRGLAAALVADTASDGIGGLKKSGAVDPVTHKLLHGLVGGAAGAIVDGEKGILPGVAGAVVSETIAETLAPDKPKDPLSESEVEEYETARQRAGLTAKFVAPLTVMFAGGSASGVGTSILTSSAAIENNFFSELTPEEHQLAAETAIEYAEAVMDLQDRYGDVVENILDGACFVPLPVVSGFAFAASAGLRGIRFARDVFSGDPERRAMAGVNMINSVARSKFGAATRLAEKGLAAVGGKGSVKTDVGAGASAPKVSRMEAGGSGSAAARPAASGRPEPAGSGASSSAAGPSRPPVASDRRTLQALDLEDQSYKLRSTGIFNKKPIEWTAPNGTQQTYKIHQRTDIDWNRVRTAGPGDFRGRTNAEAARAGIAPQLSDGFSATLHHLNQNSSGKLVEASRRYHGRFGTREQAILHGIWGKNKAHPTNPVNHSKFQQETEAYWKWRVDQ